MSEPVPIPVATDGDLISVLGPATFDAWQSRAPQTVQVITPAGRVSTFTIEPEAALEIIVAIIDCKVADLWQKLRSGEALDDSQRVMLRRWAVYRTTEHSAPGVVADALAFAGDEPASVTYVGEAPTLDEQLIDPTRSAINWWRGPKAPPAIEEAARVQFNADFDEAQALFLTSAEAARERYMATVYEAYWREFWARIDARLPQ